jgi:hypothetical protein
MTTPSDPGLQPERTELAWRRTALAVGVGSLVALRLLPASLGDPWWVLVGVGGVLVAGWIWIHGRRRLRAAQEVLRTDVGGGLLPGAVPLAVLAAFVLASGCVAVLVVVAVSLR